MPRQGQDSGSTNKTILQCRALSLQRHPETDREQKRTPHRFPDGECALQPGDRGPLPVRRFVAQSVIRRKKDRLAGLLVLTLAVVAVVVSQQAGENEIARRAVHPSEKGVEAAQATRPEAALLPAGNLFGQPPNRREFRTWKTWRLLPHGVRQR